MFPLKCYFSLLTLYKGSLLNMFRQPIVVKSATMKRRKGSSQHHRNLVRRHPHHHHSLLLLLVFLTFLLIKIYQRHHQVASASTISHQRHVNLLPLHHIVCSRRPHQDLNRRLVNQSIAFSHLQLITHLLICIYYQNHHNLSTSMKSGLSILKGTKTDQSFAALQSTIYFCNKYFQSIY